MKCIKHNAQARANAEKVIKSANEKISRLDLIFYNSSKSSTLI